MSTLNPSPRPSLTSCVETPPGPDTDMVPPPSTPNAAPSATARRQATPAGRPARSLTPTATTSRTWLWNGRRHRLLTDILLTFSPGGGCQPSPLFISSPDLPPPLSPSLVGEQLSTSVSLRRPPIVSLALYLVWEDRRSLAVASYVGAQDCSVTLPAPLCPVLSPFRFFLASESHLASPSAVILAIGLLPPSSARLVPFAQMIDSSFVPAIGALRRSAHSDCAASTAFRVLGLYVC